MDDISLQFDQNLPVSLTVFSAKADQQQINLNWATASELNNSGFELERSTNGKEFKAIGFIEGYGTTVEEQQYAFRDEEVVSNQFYYYRLKQIDFDGTFAYSNMVVASISGDDKISTRVFPNPADDIISIAGGQGEAIIFNNLGQVVKTIYLTDRIHTVNVAELPSGQYIIQMKDENNQFKTLSFIK